MSLPRWGRAEPSRLGFGLGLVALLLGLAGLRLFGGRQMVEEAVERAGEGVEQLTPRRGRSAAEWAGLGISLAIVLAVTGLVVSMELSSSDLPPLIEAQPRLEELRNEGETYYLPVEIANRGDLTAENVQVRVSLPSGESSDLEIQFLAGGEAAVATAVFSSDPSSDVAVDVLGFMEP